MKISIEERPIRTLQDFYDLMDQTADVRRQAVQDVLAEKEAAEKDVASLRIALECLKNIPGSGTEKPFERCLRMDAEMEDHEVVVDLDYEISELARDIGYLELGEAALKFILEGQAPGLLRQAEELAKKLSLGLFGGGLAKRLSAPPVRCFITDRDGTVNNYCGRYRSSTQSVYNAVFLTCFARNRTQYPIVVTSGPLAGPGLTDVSVMPPRTYVMAASKGREYIDLNNAYNSFPAPEEQSELLRKLHRQLEDLLKQSEYRKFGLIGSGLQVKFGQLTVARQDISKSVPEDESRKFLETIKGLIAKHDPDERSLRIEDTGLDIEIILTIGSGEQRKDFDKGDGVDYLDQALGLNMAEGPHLVCGDTFSDLPMLRVTMEKCGETQAVFVTRNKDLHKAVLEICPGAHIVAEPDVLVLALRMLS
ncbi:hypothetical protein SAMN05660653_01130 [Desulfonatronum thiosulfatophilum]|uniref:Uncharacterized protein n=1 Tax=Desulfonatronum thiosulfatophilum TaxID=617002 RepID=A0A1G6BR30_9BACT|nr:hypothetical protein [Desulfonatronum thiosulfatophilum]SDB23084.1 hypothetical protein SAMN05660653_01130 [Desulfonatronum thiosulfatophilum]